MIKIVTDSCSDFTVKEALNLGVTLIPLTINFENESYLDEIEISKEEFYKRLLTCKKLPKTSQPAPAYFEDVFKKAYDDGDEVICITLSAKLSGTFNTANMVKNEFNFDNVFMVDSENIAECIKILVLEAVKYKDTLKASEIVKKLEELKSRLAVYSVIDTLEYLHRGGRLSRAVALVGALLNIKPIGTMSNGVVTIISKQRGVNKGLNYIKEIVDKEEIDDDYPVYIGYASSDVNCRLLANKMFKDEKVAKNMIGNACNLSPIVGTHIGPNCCYIVYVAKNKQKF